MRRHLFFLLIAVLAFVACDPENPDYDAIDEAKIKDYITEHNINATRSNSGLYYFIEESGNDMHPTHNSLVRVKYVGMLLDSTVFDQTSDSPVSLTLNNTIKGFSEGVQLIGVGGKIKLFIPSSLGYGVNEKPKIPKNSVLIFDIELVEFY